MKLACYFKGDNAMTTDQSPTPEMLETFSYHWVFDNQNRFERKILPMRTVLSFISEIDKINSQINSGKGFELPPCFILIGSKDFVVCNKQAKIVFDAIKTEKQLLEDPDLRHGPFSDGSKFTERMQLVSDFFTN